jgi:apolipoprotein N-acyltransferase
MRTLFRLAFWGILGVLAFVTLSPIGLRPEVGPANLERCVAYALFGVAAALAFPRHRVAILLAVVAVAGILEAGQGLSPSRHGRISDFLIKAGSGAVGWLLTSAYLALAMRPKAR